jgi:4-amino-4-deoxy-L-arabinose transferase-like glycosyltransferase
LPGLLVLAAALRLLDLATRGTWDADQGHDMLVLRALVRGGVIPLLGPPTSLGDVHHGALYYFLLAPAAALTGGDSPLAVVALIALAGIAAVGVTWWLARSIGGPLAGLIAGLAMAISPAAIDESTFIWNPNLIALSSAVGLAGAWRAWTTRRPGWWLLAAAGTAVTMQCHVLGVTLLPVVGALLVADMRRRRVPSERWVLLRVGLAGLGIIALSFLPLAIHELTTDFSEVQAALTYLRAGGDPPRLEPPARFLVIASRIISWPLVGLITAGLTAAVIAIFGALGLTIWRFVVAKGEERIAVRWLALGLGWTALALSAISPSLATVVLGLPNDHYHAFADPMVFVLVGVGVAALWRTGARSIAARVGAIAPGRLGVSLGIVAFVEDPGSRRRWTHPAPIPAGLQIRGGLRVSADPRRSHRGPERVDRRRSRRRAGGDLRLAVRGRGRGPVRWTSRVDHCAARPLRGAAGPVRGRAGPDDLRLPSGVVARCPGKANAGAPNAGIRSAPGPGPGGRTRIAM